MRRGGKRLLPCRRQMRSAILSSHLAGRGSPSHRAAKARMTHNLLHWEERLWDAGHRVTKQCAAILDAVCAEGGHTTIGEIYARAWRTDRALDRSTLYRALRLFIDLGLIVAADTGKGELTYEIAHPQPHHHLVCRNCGHEQEIDDAALAAMAAGVEAHHGFAVNTDHLVLFGLCRACRDRE